MTVLFFYFGVGALAGLLAGLLGIGGGIVIVPLLYFQLRQAGGDGELIMHMAVGSSLATIVVTSLSSAYAHVRRQTVDWSAVRQLLIGIIAGSAAGAIVVTWLSSGWLRLSTGVFELAVGIQQLVRGRLALGNVAAETRLNPFIGVAIGLLSAVLGIGGGTLTVPYLLWRGVPLKLAVGSSACLGLPIAAVATLTLVVSSQIAQTASAESLNHYFYWPAIASISLGSTLTTAYGAALLQRLPERQIRILLGCLLVAAGLRLLMK